MAKESSILQIEPKKALAELARRQAQRRLIPFTRLTKENYFSSWHHELTAAHLEAVEAREIDRLMILEPPRHGKSELSSVRFPAWYIGRNPTHHIIHCSYSAELAVYFGRQVRNLTADPLYAEIFPGAAMSLDSTAMAKWYTEKGGSYIAAGVGGPIGGRGAHILNIDDPVKDRKQADSALYRGTVWNWYTDVALPRLSGLVPGPRGAIVITMTRWHKDDLAGRILNRAKDIGEKWTILELPAIAEKDDEFRAKGKALWPAAYPIEALDKIRNAQGTRGWNALYQQHPTEDEGGIFKRSWWKRYDKLPNTIELWIQSWDMSFKDAKESSYVVGQVWAKKGANKYLVDQVRDRMDFVKTVRAVREMSKKWPQATAKLVEGKANGPAVISILKDEIEGLIEVEPQGGKESRASSVSPQVEAGNVWLPEDAPWVDEFMDEHADFPKSVNDDQVDTTSQALLYLKDARFEVESWGEVESNRW